MPLLHTEMNIRGPQLSYLRNIFLMIVNVYNKTNFCIRYFLGLHFNKKVKQQ